MITADKRRNFISISELSAMLSQQVDSVVPAILPHAVREGHEWRVGSVYGEAGRSLAIHRSGARQGVWCDFSSNDLRGDIMDLIAHAVCGGDKAQAVKWAKGFLGLADINPKSLEKKRKDAEVYAKKREQDALEAFEKKQKQAKAIWLNSSSNLLGSPVEAYLKNRVIYFDYMPEIPRALRYCPSCFARENDMNLYFPAMVAAVTDGKGNHIATHRTYLQQFNHVWKKAKLKDPKKVLGSFRGGYIPISRGKSGLAMIKAPADDVVVITEGIEDALTLAMSCHEYRIIAGISVGNFANIILPEQIETVIFAADNDGKGSMADKALNQAIGAMNRAGKDVYIAKPPSGKDFNEWQINSESMKNLKGVI